MGRPPFDGFPLGQWQSSSYRRTDQSGLLTQDLESRNNSCKMVEHDFFTGRMLLRNRCCYPQLLLCLLDAHLGRTKALMSRFYVQMATLSTVSSGFPKRPTNMEPDKGLICKGKGLSGLLAYLHLGGFTHVLETASLQVGLFIAVQGYINAAAIRLRAWPASPGHSVPFNWNSH